MFHVSKASHDTLDLSDTTATSVARTFRHTSTVQGTAHHRPYRDLVDGAKIEARGLGRSTGTPAGTNARGALTLPMPADDAAISLVAYADGKASDAARIELKGTGTASDLPATDDALKPSSTRC